MSTCHGVYRWWRIKEKKAFSWRGFGPIMYAEEKVTSLQHKLILTDGFYLDGTVSTTNETVK